MTVTQQPLSSGAQSPVALTRTQRVRRVVAWLLLVTLVVWPAWSLVDFCLYLQRYQPTPSDAKANWEARDARFASLSKYLEPGQIVAYHTLWPLPPNGSMLHEAQLAGAPVIITDVWYPHTHLVLVDMADDTLLKQTIREHDYVLLNHLGDGLALCRRGDKTPDRPRQDKDVHAAEVTP